MVNLDYCRSGLETFSVAFVFLDQDNKIGQISKQELFVSRRAFDAKYLQEIQKCDSLFTTGWDLEV